MLLDQLLSTEVSGSCMINVKYLWETMQFRTICMNEWCSLFLIRSAANTAFLEFGLSKERVNGEVIIQIHNTNGNWKIAILRTPYKLESTENTQKTIAKMSLSILMAVKTKTKTVHLKLGHMVGIST